MNKLVSYIRRTVEKIYAMGDGAFGEALTLEKALQARALLPL